MIDVRSVGNFNASGTINVTLHELESSLAKIPKSDPRALCHASGTRSAMAKLIPKKNGYPEVYNISTWDKLLG